MQRNYGGIRKSDIRSKECGGFECVTLHPLAGEQGDPREAEERAGFLSLKLDNLRLQG